MIRVRPTWLPAAVVALVSSTVLLGSPARTELEPGPRDGDEGVISYTLSAPAILVSTFLDESIENVGIVLFQRGTSPGAIACSSSGGAVTHDVTTTASVLRTAAVATSRGTLRTSSSYEQDTASVAQSTTVARSSESVWVHGGEPGGRSTPTVQEGSCDSFWTGTTPSITRHPIGADLNRDATLVRVTRARSSGAAYQSEVLASTAGLEVILAAYRAVAAAEMSSIEWNAQALRTEELTRLWRLDDTVGSESGLQVTLRRDSGGVRIEKLFQSETFACGDTIQCKFHVENIGPDAILRLLVVDRVPRGLSICEAVKPMTDRDCTIRSGWLSDGSCILSVELQGALEPQASFAVTLPFVAECDIQQQ
jgi:uncharacterized repeat protein (TIGR01451 family)